MIKKQECAENNVQKSFPYSQISVFTLNVNIPGGNFELRQGWWAEYSANFLRFY